MARRIRYSVPANWGIFVPLQSGVSASTWSYVGRVTASRRLRAFGALALVAVGLLAPVAVGEAAGPAVGIPATENIAPATMVMVGQVDGQRLQIRLAAADTPAYLVRLCVSVPRGALVVSAERAQINGSQACWSSTRLSHDSRERFEIRIRARGRVAVRLAARAANAPGISRSVLTQPV